MNTPTEQATLYRKAAETIEMCAEHGIEPILKMQGWRLTIKDNTFSRAFDSYEFPLAVIEGQLVWVDTVVYRVSDGMKLTIKSKNYVRSEAGYDLQILGNWRGLTLTPQKQPLCEVEGKPVYVGDKLWCDNELRKIVSKHPHCDSLQWVGRSIVYDAIVYDEDPILGMPLKYWSWNPPKPKTVMVELLVEDARAISELNAQGFNQAHRIEEACRKALDNLQGS